MGVGCFSSSFFIFIIIKEVVTKLNNDKVNHMLEYIYESCITVPQKVETSTDNPQRHGWILALFYGLVTN